MTSSAAILLTSDVEAQQICFRCHYVGLGAELGARSAHCPVCSFPLIVNSANVSLRRNELDALFEQHEKAPSAPSLRSLPGLPGVSPPRARAPRRLAVVTPATPLVPVQPVSKAVPPAPVVALVKAEQPVKRRKARRITRLLHEIAAGGLLVAGILLVLGVAGVL